jgi:serine protease inhibitor ecotin
MAVERLRTCEDVRELAQGLGVTRRWLYEWRVELETVELEEDASRPSKHTSSYHKQIHQLKRMLDEKAMEVDFFKGAFQKVDARREKKGGTGERASITKSEK